MYKIIIAFSALAIAFSLMACQNPSGTDTKQVTSTYTVNFDSDGGSSVASVAGVASGSTVIIPADPTKTGYSFGGWYADLALTQYWDFESSKVTADTTLHANWIPAKLARAWFDKQDGLNKIANDDDTETIFLLKPNGEYAMYKRTHYAWNNAAYTTDCPWLPYITAFTQDAFIPTKTGRFSVKNGTLATTITKTNLIGEGLFFGVITESLLTINNITAASAIGLKTRTEVTAMIKGTPWENQINLDDTFGTEINTFTYETTSQNEEMPAKNVTTLRLQNGDLYKATYKQTSGEETLYGFKSPRDFPADVTLLINEN